MGIRRTILVGPILQVKNYLKRKKFKKVTIRGIFTQVISHEQKNEPDFKVGEKGSKKGDFESGFVVFDYLLGFFQKEIETFFKRGRYKDLELFYLSHCDFD